MIVHHIIITARATAPSPAYRVTWISLTLGRVLQVAQFLPLFLIFLREALSKGRLQCWSVSKGFGIYTASKTLFKPREQHVQFSQIYQTTSTSIIFLFSAQCNLIRTTSKVSKAPRRKKTFGYKCLHLLDIMHNVWDSI